MKFRVCHEQDVPLGEKRAYTVKNIPLVLVHSTQGAFYAIYGFCPHQRAPLCDGILGGQTVANQPGQTFQYERQSEILRCPWHGFSFDITTGACLTDAERLRVKTFPVSIRDQHIYLDI